MWHDADGMGWWMIWGMAMMLLFWGGLAALIIWGVISFAGRDQRSDPLDIAKERLARGEISQEKFERISSTLRSV
jgi:putative membrane protein